MAKAPAFQFYPGDWQRDASLRSCSVGARGCWIEMICIMHQADPYGHLVINGKPVSDDTLARMIGATQRETKKWLGELEQAGVFNRDSEGAILSRRMVKDEATRKARAEGGKLGGNPALKGSRKVAGKVNLHPNLEPTPSSSSSSSPSVPLNPLGGSLGEIAIPEGLQRSKRFMDALARYAKLQGSHGRFNLIAFQDLVQKLNDYPEPRATAYLRYWTTENKFKPFWDGQWENYKPKDDERPSKSAPKTYEPRVKLEEAS